MDDCSSSAATGRSSHAAEGRAASTATGRSGPAAEGRAASAATGRSSHAAEGRAASEVVGFVLVAALVVLALVTVQAFAVPAWNADTERSHAERVQGDLLELDADIVSAAGFGADRNARVELGVRYPTRPFLLTPNDGTGTLSSEGGTASVSNFEVVGDDDAHDYLGGALEADTRTLAYRPDYTRYPEQTTRLEGGAVFNTGSGSPVVRANSDLVDGRQISLVALRGEPDRATTGDATIPVRAESAPANTVLVRSADENEDEDPITIELPTTVEDPAVWERALGAEPNVQELSVEDGTLTVELDPDETYRLRAGAVRLGEDVEPPDAEYLSVRGSGDLDPGDQVTVEARDGLNNPVAGESVTFERPDEATVTRETDSQGRASLRAHDPGEYEARLDGAGAGTTATFSVGGERDDPEVVSASGETRTDGPHRQYAVDYTVEDAGDDPSGIQRVSLRLVDANGVVTATTHRYDGEIGPEEGRWVTSWLPTSDLNGPVTVEIRVVDRAGNDDEAEVPL